MFEMLSTTEYFGNPLLDYVQAGIAFLLVIIVLAIARAIVVGYVRRFAKQTSSRLDDTIVDAIAVMRWPMYLAVALYAAARFLVLPGESQRIIGIVALVVVTFYVIRGVQAFIDLAFRSLRQRYEGTDRALDPTILKVLGRIAKGLLWFVAFILVLQNVGYNVSALVAGLGVGGIAIALAVESILADLFASFSLYFDRPFQVGDFISFEGTSGTVQHIGLKSTRIRAVAGHEIIVSNKKLTESTVNNFKRMKQRNVSLNIHVAPETSMKNLRAIPDMLRGIVEKHDDAEMKSVYFKDFTDAGYRFVVFYSLPERDYSLMMHVRNDLNYQIAEAFEESGISLAFPIERVYKSDN